MLPTHQCWLPEQQEAPGPVLLSPGLKPPHWPPQLWGFISLAVLSVSLAHALFASSQIS